nr:hypothetical protein [Tanacetum cinerariifolium]
MVNLPPPNNDPNIPEGDQAPTAPDGFAPYNQPNNNNGWIEWNVPPREEVDELMIDPEFDEEEMDDDDDDDWDDYVEWLMALVTPLRATMTVSSTYEVGGPSIAVAEGPSFPLPVPGLPAPPTMIEDLSTRLGYLEYRHGVLMRKMEETALHRAESQNQQLRTRVAEMETREGIMMSYMLWMEERLTVLEKRLSGPPSGPQ